MRISPAVMLSRPATMRSNVDLPQPDGPTKTQNSPSAMVSETSRTTGPLPKSFATWSNTISAMQHHAGQGVVRFDVGQAARHEVSVPRQLWPGDMAEAELVIEGLSTGIAGRDGKMQALGAARGHARHQELHHAPAEAMGARLRQQVDMGMRRKRLQRRRIDEVRHVDQPPHPIAVAPGGEIIAGIVDGVAHRLQ